jgi:lysophospholipase L1-like esterase
LLLSTRNGRGYFATANTDYPNSDSFYTAPIEINPGDIVRWKKYSLYVNGTNLYGGRVLTPSKVYAYNLSQSSITDKGTYFEFTYAGTDTRYAQFNGIISDIDNFIVVKNISYPASYISYGYAMDKDININDNSIETKNIKDKAVSYEKLSDSAITTIKNLNKSFLSYLNLNALCIGDSLTQGAYYDTIHNGQSINENYPYYLSKLSKWNVTNGGASGYTTQQWYDIKALNYNFANFDTFIICLGTNGGLTDTIDTDCVGTDYNNYADTNTGCYCKLIEKILAQNPNAKIYMTNVFASSGDLALTNAVLKKIAIKYNLPFINIYDGTLNGKALYHPFGNTVHFGKVGNLFFAKQIFDQITEYINNNLANYETLLL